MNFLTFEDELNNLESLVSLVENLSSLSSEEKATLQSAIITHRSYIESLISD